MNWFSYFKAVEAKRVAEEKKRLSFPMCVIPLIVFIALDILAIIILPLL